MRVIFNHFKTRVTFPIGPAQARESYVQARPTAGKINIDQPGPASFRPAPDPQHIIEAWSVGCGPARPVQDLSTYGLETLDLSELHQHKLQVCENNWIRRIAGVKRVERRRMEDLREEVGTKACIVGKIVKSRMKWAGHMVRMKDDKFRLAECFTNLPRILNLLLVFLISSLHFLPTVD